MTVSSPAIQMVVDGVPAVLPQLRVLLRGGRVGWYQRTQVDCYTAAVATALRVPYDELPLFRNDTELDMWAVDHGYRMERHHEPPVDRACWLGVSPRFETHGGARHMLVMSHARVLFDPAMGWVFEGGQRAEPTRQLEYGITLEPMEGTC